MREQSHATSGRDQTTELHGDVTELLHRGACLLQARHGVALGAVSFVWWTEGEEVSYTATLDWPAGSLNGPRAVIRRKRTGELLCMSLPGQPFDIDPESIQSDALWDTDGGDDDRPAHTKGRR